MTYVQRVFKYPLPVDDTVELELPRGARILRCDVQRPDDIAPTIWALVDDDVPTETRRFRIAGTGHLLSPRDTGYHVATVIAARGSLVWHVFEIVPPTESSAYREVLADVGQALAYAGASS